MSPVDQPVSFVQGLPRWLQWRVVRWIGLTLALSVLTVTVALLAYQWHSIERTHIERVALHARVLADHADRALAGLDVALRSFGETLEDDHPEREAKRVSSRLERTAAGLPFVRSLSVVDVHRRVLASSDVRNIGTQVGFDHMPPAVGADQLHWGDLRAARDLADEDSPGGMDEGYQPVARVHRTQDERSYALLATLNPAYFRNQHALLVGNAPLETLMSTYKGQVLARSEGIQALAGTRITQSTVFREYLPRREFGEFIGTGADGASSVNAFRVARRFPLVLWVQEPQAVLRDEIWTTGRWVLVSSGLALSLLAVLALLVRRSLKGHEAMTLNLVQANKDLIASETRRWALLEAAIDAVVTIDEQGCVLEFNAAAEAMFGYKRDRLLGQPMHEFLVPEQYRQAHTQGMAHYIRTGHGPVLNRRIEITAVRATGEEFPVELTIVPAKVAGGVYFAATIRDITKRRQADVERNELMSRFRSTALDLSMQKLAMDQHAIVVIADDHALVRFANNKFLEVSGRRIDEVMGQPLVDVICTGPGQIEIYEEGFKQVSRGDVWHGELVNLRADGSLFWLNSTIVPVPGDDGHPREYISVHSDVTRLKEAELEAASIRSRELLIGSRIQKSLLVNPPGLSSASIWVSSSSQASQGIDGDFVDVIPMGADCVDIVLADVMGKGIPAALMGAATKMQLSRLLAVLLADRRRNGRLPSPAEIISSLHQAMAGHLQALEAFVTMTYVRVDSRNQRVTWVGCGHEEPLLLVADGQRKRLRNQHPPIGVIDLVTCEQDSMPMRGGDALFMCSDGVTDAVLADGLKLGEQRLLEMVENVSRQQPTPATVLHTLRREIIQPDTSLTDDATMMYLMLRNEEPRAWCWELPPSLQGIDQVRKHLGTVAAAASIEPDALGLYVVACVEAYTNIVRHARGLLADAPIEMLACMVSADVVEVEFMYLGEPFSPPQVKMEVEWSEYPEGGLGLTIIHSACEQVQYSSENGRNTTRLRSYPSVRSNL